MSLNLTFVVYFADVVATTEITTNTQRWCLVHRDSD